MLLLYFFFAFVFCSSASGAPSSYQSVKFFRSGGASSKSESSSVISTPEKTQRTTRSFGFDHDLLAASIFDQDLIVPEWNKENYEIKHNFEINRGHLTPDFSNGLEYPDPFLLTGFEAKRAANFLYRKPLFFGQINHIQALEYNQEMRRKNGLAGHKLGSLRSHLPFYRFKKIGFGTNSNFFL